MNLFFTLHRMYVATWVLLLVGGVVWLFPRSAISEPLVDWYAVWQNKSEVTVRPVGEVSGTVIKVIDGASFTMRAADRQFYNVALLGAVPPTPAPSSADLELALRSKNRLADLVLSNEVQVTLTWVDPQRRGVGIVHLGDTNVNAVMVESGLVEFKRKFVKGLPLLDQYVLLRADRRAKEQKLSSLN